MRSKLIGLLVAVLALVSFPAAASAADGISWEQLEQGRPLAGGDRVVVSYEPLTSTDDVQFVLRRAPHLYWWKGLEVKDSSDHQVAFLENKASPDGTELPPVSYSTIDYGNLYLWKTGWFGVHIAAYKLPVDARIKGKRVVFTWVTEG